MAKHKGFGAQMGGYTFYVEFYRDTNGHSGSNQWIVKCDEESHPRHIVYSVDGLFSVMEKHNG